MVVSVTEAEARRLLGRLRDLERFLSFLAFVVLIGVVFLDVVSREVTGTGLHWALQAGVYANLAVVMLGLGVASADGSHLRPQFADRWLPAAWDPVLVRCQEACTALFCLAFALVAAGAVNETRVLGERSPVLGNLIWPVQAVIPLVFAVAVLRHGAFAIWPGLRPRASAAPAAGTE